MLPPTSVIWRKIWEFSFRFELTSANLIDSGGDDQPERREFGRSEEILNFHGQFHAPAVDKCKKHCNRQTRHYGSTDATGLNADWRQKVTSLRHRFQFYQIVTLLRFRQFPVSFPAFLCRELPIGRAPRDKFQKLSKDSIPLFAPQLVDPTKPDTSRCRRSACQK